MAEKTDLLGSEGKPDDEVDGLRRDYHGVSEEREVDQLNKSDLHGVPIHPASIECDLDIKWGL